MNRGKMNFWVDVGIGIAGLLSAASGLVFLLPGDPTSGVLGASYKAWSDLHTWSSLVAITGIVVHVALHWKWMVSMTRHTFSTSKLRHAGEGVPDLAQAGTATGLSRRAFLVFGGAATVLAGAAVAGYKAVSASAGRDTPQASLDGSQLAATDLKAGVACPRGLSNDPYPGQCHFYVDSDGDGICDYSVPGSASMLVSNDSWGSSAGGARRRPRMGQP